MIAAVSAAVSTSPLGRGFAVLRNGPLRAASEFVDRAIPLALVAVIAVAFAWIAFAPT